MKETDLSVKWFNTVYFPKNRTARAVLYEEKTLPRLRKREICFFTPWGPRYDWKDRGAIIAGNDAEVKTIGRLSQVLSDLKNNMPDKHFRWIFMGADLYGTRINGLPQEAVGSYFESLQDLIDKFLPDAEFRLWSTFDEAAENYRQEVAQNFAEYTDNNLLARATMTACVMGRNSDSKTYIVERIAEAILIENKFSPVKISCVARHKDDKVDFELPRLYVLPENLQAPWFPHEGIRKK